MFQILSSFSSSPSSLLFLLCMLGSRCQTISCRRGRVEVEDDFDGGKGSVEVEAERSRQDRLLAMSNRTKLDWN